MIQGGVHPARRLPVGVFPFGRLAGEFTAVHSRWVYIRRVLAVEDRGSCMRYVTVRAEPPDGSRFHPLGAAMAEQSAVTPGPIHQVEMVDGGTGVSLTEIRAGLETGVADAAAVDELEAKQAEAESKRARMESYRELSAAYLELAESLPAEAGDGSDGLERVVRFEVERDAPAYFEEVETIAERYNRDDGTAEE